jgi:molecular chaperone GrpE
MTENDKENSNLENNPEVNPEVADVPAEDDNVVLLEDARARADEHYDLFLRTKADLENLHKRMERELANVHKFALEKFAAELLPVKDSLEMALQAGGDDADLASHQEGLELTLRMFNGVLEKFGVKEINPLHEPFNPEWHQAMSMQEAPDQPANTVIAVMQKGYSLNDRLLRPAMVVVTRGGAAAKNDTQTDQEA